LPGVLILTFQRRERINMSTKTITEIAVTQEQISKKGRWWDLRDKQSWLFIGPPFAFLGFALFWPVLYMLFLSFTRWDGLGKMEFVGIKNYANILQDARVWLALVNNLKWACGALLVPTSLGLFLAILLTRVKSAVGKSFFRVVYFLPQMLAVAITAIIWRWMYAPQDGPINTVLRMLGSSWQPQWLADSQLALIAIFIAYVWTATGFSMLIFESAIVCTDESMFEAARIDGANWFQEIFLILIPTIKQAIVTVATVSTIWSFQIFDLIYLTTRGGPGDATRVLALEIYSSTFRSRDIGRSSALSALLLVVVLILATILFKMSRNSESEKCP
jgi:ABC-type sugar transport system permease subunit